MNRLVTLFGALAAGSLVLCAQVNLKLNTQLRVSPVKALMKIRTAEILKSIGKEVTLEGYFYDGSIPMIVDDIEKVRCDKPLEADAYIPLVGHQLQLKWGDHVRVTGVMEKGTVGLAKESAVLRIQPSTKLQVVSKTALNWGGKVNFRFDPAILQAITAMKAPHAVLIAGGWDATNNHIRYWNDLKTMYALLLSKGYPKANIKVLYADGVAKDASMPVNYSATGANISLVFSTLAGQTGIESPVYIMTNDHGTQLAGGKTGLCLWNHEVMSDTDFAGHVNKVKNYGKMIIQMKQCYSGGFVAPLTKANRIVMSSCSPTQVSWSNATATYGEFTFWYFSALMGYKPDGSGTVNADANGDGKVSILEAYNFARSHDGSSETPLYDDNGVVPAQTAVVPAGGDGALGAGTFLK
jgi:hypothetical protein